MKKIIAALLICATLFGSDPSLDTNMTAGVETAQKSEHGVLFNVAVIVGIPIVIAGGIVYYAVLAPIALVCKSFDIPPFDKE